MVCKVCLERGGKKSSSACTPVHELLMQVVIKRIQREESSLCATGAGVQEKGLKGDLSL